MCVVGAVGMRAINLFACVQRVKEIDLVACCDINEKALADCAKEHSLKRTFTRYDDVISDKDIDIVMISTPDYLHGEMTLAALEAGKHVYVEVPMCDTSVDDCIKIVKASERHDVKVQMGNQTRWWPSYYTLKQYVGDGKIGQLIYAESEYWHNLHYGGNLFELNEHMSFQTDRPNWRTGYGHPAQPPMSSGGMHALDSLRWVMGEEFCEVSCAGNDNGMVPCPGYTDEQGFVVALFKTPSNAIARVSAGFALVRRYSLGGAVYGTNGSLEMDRLLFSSWPVDTELGLHLTTLNDYKKDHKARAKKIDPVMPPYDLSLEDPEDTKQARPGAASIALQDLVDAISEDRQPLINVYEGARSSAAAICARMSSQQRRRIYIPSFHQRMK